MSHGELVDQALQRIGGLKDQDIQLFHADSGAPFDREVLVEAPSDQLPALLTQYAGRSAASFLDAISDNLETVLLRQPSVEVINISQSQSPFRIGERLLEKLFTEADFEKQVGSAFGFPASLPVTDIATHLLSFVTEAIKTDEEAARAGLRYKELASALQARGTQMVVAAGNQGELVAGLRRTGVAVCQTALRSLLSGPSTITVGSLDKDGNLARYTTPDPEIDVRVSGTVVLTGPNGKPIEFEGTSLAVPRYCTSILKSNSRRPPEYVSHPKTEPSQTSA